MTPAAGAFDAAYLDGISSRRHDVRVEVEGADVRIRGDGVSLDLALADLRVQPRLGRLPLRIQLPGGGVLVAEAQAVQGVLPVPKASGLAHRLESHLGVVVGSIAGVVVAGWLFYAYGIPWLAREAAERLPPDIEAGIAVEGLQALDRYLVKPTRLGPERRERLQNVFRQVAGAAEGESRNARLELRDGGVIGPNALAIPGGVIVLTDQLANLLDDEHVAAVLAHEIGHLRHRHGARHILQDTIAGLLLLALFGDASSIAAVAATAPTILVNNGYSRAFEREADTHAYELLRRTGRSPRLLGESLAVLEKDHERGHPGSCPAQPDEPAQPAGEAKEPAERPARRTGLGYISTHPATEERIRAAEQAALQTR